MRLIWMLALLISAQFSVAETRVPQTSGEISLSFAPLVKQAAPAVVNIYAKRVTQTAAPTNPFMDDPFFERFFRGFGQPRPRVQNSLGSGVILSDDGIVVSNYHVVGMATEIRVVLNDRREYAARVLLGDQESDLAILQVEGAADLPSLSLRDSDTVEVGELVLAIGNPFGVGQTVSSGIVSGLARSGGANGSGFGYFIQTDAPINPGNSGGALIDVAGRLIGINTSILTRSGGSNGIGFAIPANLVAAFVAQARDGNSRFVRPWAGLAGQPVDQDMAQSLGLDRPEGVVISGMHPVGPYTAAGFQVGDVILSVDGARVNSPAEMIFRMAVAGEGRDAIVTRMRDGVFEDVPVALVVPPEDPPRRPITLSDDSAIPGLTLAQINPAVISEMNLPIGAEGVFIAETGRLGTRLGLRRGDIIQRIDRRAVATSAEAADRLSRAERGTRLDLIRGGQRIRLRF
ncbi:MAG: trypsin-like peptidase domain-containing protein [Rhodobacteraceae bacterium]|nr:trypsin-like peptidase domain-containing protein [Paracoccaceae bacterium]